MTEAENAIPAIVQFGWSLKRNWSTTSHDPRASGRDKRRAAIKWRQQELVKMIPKKQIDVKTRITAQRANAPARAVASLSISSEMTLGIKKK